MRTIIRTWDIYGHVSLAAAIQEAAELAHGWGSPPGDLLNIVARSPNGDFGVGKAQLVETITAGIGATYDLELLP